ncbi:hypothetical protein VIGAN_08134100 [Vigna angularis var. angularis]|uniref:6-phosphogluconate dehydrogenase NADP-binding domain-containing protein n=1 Tax=Vigna angularis var. angularis TaxID=157739 RepID=A0A0S3SPF5_PHAAN|nr:hypothetical protein VIGAN_08134100 [Vigna angularis var. angularis]
MSSLEKELVPNLLINCCKPSKTESEQQQEQPVAGKGWHSVDAPVSCGDRGVKNGTLAIFVVFGGCDGLRWSNQGGRRGGFVIVLKDPKPQIHNFRNSNPNVAKELQFAFQSTEKKAKATPRSRAQTRSPFSAKTLEGEILSSRNVVLEPLETRLSFPLRNPKQNPGRGKEKERNEQRAITIYPENTKTLSSRALSTLSLSPPFVPALNAETP